MTAKNGSRKQTRGPVSHLGGQDSHSTGKAGSHSPVDALVVVAPIEELDLLEGLLAGVVAGQVRVHSQEEIESCSAWRDR